MKIEIIPDKAFKALANPSLTQEWGNSANWGVGSVLSY